MSLPIPLARALALSAGLVLAAAPAPAQPDETAFAAETRDYLERLEAFGFAGVVLVARDDRPLLAEGYGLADRERGIPWTPGTVSTVGSITKQYTGAAILALAEDGRLRLDDPLTAHFENVPEDKRQITLHHLLTHSSGIGDLSDADDWDPIGRDEFVAAAFAQPLAFAPGTDYDYSNAGYSLLGAVIEKLAGGGYEQFLRSRFLLPLGLYETGYVLAGWGDESRLAQGYRGDEAWGTVLGRPMADDGPYWVLRANGGIHTTAWDMLRWSRALLEGRALSAPSRELLWAPHVREGEGADFHYGYGWVTMELPNGNKIVGHNGGNGIFFADLALVPEHGITIFLMTNVAAGNAYVERLLEQIVERLAAGKPYPDVPRLVPGESGRLAPLVGEWTFAGGGRLRATVVEGALRVEPLDAAGFGRLMSNEPLSPQTIARHRERTRDIEEPVRALLTGDLAPLHRLYGETPVTLERLEEAWGDRLAGFVERHGPSRGIEVLGTARRGGRDETLVRFLGERGGETVAFVWSPADDGGGLRGISIRGTPAPLDFRPEASGGLAAWDPSRGSALRLRAEGTAPELRLVFGDREAPQVARRPGA